ncbi:MAG TPA: GNAT family N-acetyltransferase [Pyrinomonadaceae bacterium]|nr:GNAT family N-acetyltransferase [Pyrinomonadaceae bacterium]
MTPTIEKEIIIHPINSIAEMHEVEELQRIVWQVPDIEVVPNSQLIAAVKAGGVLLGAFERKKMVGFAYGFVSYEKGQMAHHSHMLAVLPEYRNYKLGEKLKRAQKDFVLRQGITIMSWTFDPLQSLNAYFNFHKLGVVSDTYFVDFYGDDAPSFLHQNSTDRLWVFWHLDQEKPKPEVNLESVKRLVQMEKGEIPNTFDFTDEEFLAIEIPTNINKLQDENLELAVEWRKATRKAFVESFRKGYTATEFYRMNRDGQDYGVYLLKRK